MAKQYYRAFDEELAEATLENILVHWLTEEKECIIIRRDDTIQIEAMSLKLVMADEKISLVCWGHTILTSSIYDGDRFEEIKNTIEACIEREHPNRCKGCAFEWTHKAHLRGIETRRRYSKRHRGSEF